MTDIANQWRAETPGIKNWSRTARPADTNKYFMVSADCHANEPATLWLDRIDKKFRSRLPTMKVDADGKKWVVMEGFRPTRIRQTAELEGEDGERSKAGATVEGRFADHKRDGVDAEIIFPNKGLAMWASRDAEFVQAQCRIWNDWAWETYGPHNDTLSPMACLATADIEGSIKEIYRVAKLGFRGIAIPCKPVFGQQDYKDPNYNLPMYDPMWAAIEETGLPVTIHISTGKDPRTATGNGGAVVNYVAHALAPTFEPVANICASGVLERFPKLKFATIEAGIGWVAWVLQAMDEVYLKHHMWVRPKLQGLPSEYFRAHFFASFQDDEPGIRQAIDFDLTDNFLWANDYPHHEGTWPHSAAAIERTMKDLSDHQREKILGLNAVRLFNFKIPERFKQQLVQKPQEAVVS